MQASIENEFEKEEEGYGIINSPSRAKRMRGRICGCDPSYTWIVPWSTATTSRETEKEARGDDA